MKIPLSPPAAAATFAAMLSTDLGRHKLQELVSRGIGPAPDGKYRHWDILRHLKPPDGLTVEEWWFAIKMARQAAYQPLPLWDRGGHPFRYALLDILLKMLHEIDQNAGGAIKGTEQITSGDTRDTYIIKTLMEEAITSSQLEGASTTREVAREMIRTGRRPLDRSEQMIYNNYQAMQFIRRLREEPLTPGILMELHRLLTEHTLDDPGAAGRLRRPDEPIQVVDEVGTVLHTPPAASELAARVEAMCDFANADNATRFVHPVIRAIVLHFWLAYDHPFVDGNGRTARALFYWAMAREGYWLCEFLSISRILNKAPGRYSRSFLYTETDDNDLTYFLLNQLQVILRAIDDLHQYLRRKEDEYRRLRNVVRHSRTVSAMLNHRQIAVLNHALRKPGFRYTIESHRRSHSVSYQTARTDLLYLSKVGLLDLMKTGRRFDFMAPPDLGGRLERLGTRRARRIPRAVRKS